jgi:hypothetical protein
MMTNGVKRIALIGIAAIIMVGVLAIAVISVSHGKTERQPEKTRTDLAKISDFPATSTDDGLKTLLLAAFRSNRLEELWSADIPNGPGRLVLAAPTPDGTSETGSCSDAGRLCAFYVTGGADGAGRLLVSGERISGFLGVEAFEDGGHARIATAFSLYNYSNVGRYRLDLKTGELVPILMLEIDSDESSATSLQASGYGDILNLSISGSRVNGRFIPSKIAVTTDNGTTVMGLRADLVAGLAKRTANAASTVPAIRINPSNDDTRTLAIHLDLFGMPYVFDLSARTLEPQMSQ